MRLVLVSRGWIGRTARRSGSSDKNQLSSDAEFDRWVKEKERQRQVLRDGREQRELEYRRTLEKRKLEKMRLARLHQAREEQWA